MHRVATAHVHRATRRREALGLGEVLPHHRDHRAGAVAELQAQIVAAVAAGAALDCAHQQYLVDLCAV